MTFDRYCVKARWWQQSCKAESLGEGGRRDLTDFINAHVQPGMVVDQIVRMMQAIYPSISLTPFDECNRISITQIMTTIYYHPDEVIGVLANRDIPRRPEIVNDNNNRPVNKMNDIILHWQ